MATARSNHGRYATARVVCQTLPQFRFCHSLECQITGEASACQPAAHSSGRVQNDCLADQVASAGNGNGKPLGGVSRPFLPALALTA